ncbi:FecR family protein [Filimonas lacunae]|uniref:FecR family protein n=1 Tax=Filimonas lacunae TaxID=477680 RepID=A0A173MJV8_9BACT|nr:FecR family protein [Filimonas lacunae]BAV07923.1 anti-sigma factor [Filimonas lacunae]SIT06588.1 FecR family protein [Filimonas lacunae]
MQQNHPDIDILVKYINGECSEQECLQVEQLLRENAALQQEWWKLNEAVKLVNTYKETGDINIEEEWKRARTAIYSSIQAGEAIEEPVTKPVSRVYTLLRRLAVAASVITVVAGAFYFVTQKVNKVEERVAIVPKQNAGTELITWRNVTGKTERKVLPDGSVVFLNNGSAITYPGVLAQHGMDVQLDGEARFEVVTNKLRPFTVSGEGLVTKVLGTIFEMSADKTRDYIVVRLFDGKVAVKPSVNSEEVQLNPGYQLVYNKRTFKASVSKMPGVKAKDSKGTGAVSEAVDQLNMPVAKSSWYMFNNQPLNKIFDQLSGMYKTKIHYNEADLKNLYFIGQFSKSDSIETILSQIVESQNLRYNKTEDGYEIRK